MEGGGEGGGAGGGVGVGGDVCCVVGGTTVVLEVYFLWYGKMMKLTTMPTLTKLTSMTTTLDQVGRHNADGKQKEAAVPTAVKPATNNSG